MARHSYDDRVTAVYLDDDPAPTIAAAGIVTVGQIEMRLQIEELLKGDPWGQGHWPRNEGERTHL